MSDARQAILDRIRGALADVPAQESPENVEVDRSYLVTDPAPRAEILERFVERVREYKAIVHEVAPSELAGAIADACARRGVKRLVVPADLEPAWFPPGVALIQEPGLTNHQIEDSDGVLTAAAIGIAQTGTIVLDSGPGQGRRAISLLPDYHLCVIREDQVVSLVPEAVRRLSDVAGNPSRPITFISGPSATSDIELNRVEGVHGPRTLEVLVVTEHQSVSSP
jgi:L-lactate dehydrogenase complex protein LldG